MLSQLVLVISQATRKQVTGIGGFILMSFLFFGIRPLYIVIENDWALLDLYNLSVDISDISDAMLWSSLGLWLFAIAAFCAPRIYSRYFINRRKNNLHIIYQPIKTGKKSLLFIGLQLTTLLIMLAFARVGRQLYTSSLGAYIYDFPVVLQSINLFAFIVLLGRWIKKRTFSNLFYIVFSAMLFVFTTWLMRDISLFRGFYIAGAVVAVLAALYSVGSKSTFIILIALVVGMQPFFQYLGEDRTLSNTELLNTNIIERVIGGRTLKEVYWAFYDSKGDMNIFDTFVAAKMSEPSFRPYLWSWLYVPLHWIPRKFWEGKPIAGVTQDLTFTNGAPTSPGIAGFFLLDGGQLWMLCSMAVLGFLVSMLDEYILSMPRGNLQAMLIGIISINGMLLSRVFLWQYFYQMLYSLVAVVMLSNWLTPQHDSGGMTKKNNIAGIK